MIVKSVLAGGGMLKPILIPAPECRGFGLCNPSVLVDQGKILVNLRNVNYILYHCEKEQLNSCWGPLAYLNPEHDQHLRTHNFLCELTPSLDIASYKKIDMALDKDPLWEFVGLEDARLVRWGGLYAIGVRRDTTTNGVGRMELSELVEGREVSRYRIEPPSPSYCEKNWMPVLDRPFHFVKWVNPTEVVVVDIKTLRATQLRPVDEDSTIKGLPDLRGGSQLIPWREYYICIVHDVNLFNNPLGQKNGVYRHRFVVFDRDLKLVKIGEQFSFMGARIEFCCGLAEWRKDLLVTFAFQDNCGFILSIPEAMIEQIVGVR
jgi:hypothetical protein